jgi:hypothetical protein
MSIMTTLDDGIIAVAKDAEICFIAMFWLPATAPARIPISSNLVQYRRDVSTHASPTPRNITMYVKTHRDESKPETTSGVNTENPMPAEVYAHLNPTMRPIRTAGNIARTNHDTSRLKVQAGLLFASLALIRLDMLDVTSPNKLSIDAVVEERLTLACVFKPPEGEYGVGDVASCGSSIEADLDVGEIEALRFDSISDIWPIMRIVLRAIADQRTQSDEVPVRADKKT